MLIGTSAVGLRDFVATPRSAAQPGVEVHAEIIDQILSGEFLTRPDWAPGAEIVVAVVLTLLLLAAVLSVGPVLGAIAALIIIAAAIATSWFAFANGHLVLDPILPSVSVLSVYIVATALLLLLTDRERQYVRRAFSQYLAPAMVERLAQDPDGADARRRDARDHHPLQRHPRLHIAVGEDGPAGDHRASQPLPDADDGRAARSRARRSTSISATRSCASGTRRSRRPIIRAAPASRRSPC